jgi:hypothetical protein
LAVALGVGGRGKAQFDAHVVAVIAKQLTGELGAVVCNDAVGHSESRRDAPDELEGRMLVDLDDRVSLGPLGELIDGDIQVLIPASSRFEGFEDV